MQWLKTKRINTFTSVPYAGNPAWVIIGADADTEQSRLIKMARELNPLSDTTFIFPYRGDADVLLRFFTKSEEVGFSGHGTIAAYIAVEHEYFVKMTEPVTCLKQKTKTGIQPIELRVQDGKIHRVTVSLPTPRVVDREIEMKTVANFLGISPVEIIDTSLPVQAIELGLIQLIVPVKSIDLLLELQPNYQLMKNYCERFGIVGVTVFSREVREKNSTAHMRQFAPAIGILEDPASGGAAACLGYYLVSKGVVTAEEMTRIVVEQGYAMQRPATIYVHVYTVKSDIVRVAFGGQGVVTFDGRAMLP